MTDGKLVIVPAHRDESFDFIAEHHRHHMPPQGYKFAIGVELDSVLVGVVTVGRPVSRHLDNGFTAEVTRCCTFGTKNVASKLYAAAWRAARAMGYTRLITYTLASEAGTSLYAAGWAIVGQTKTDRLGWDRPSRARDVKAPVGQKTLWEVAQ